MNTEKPELGSIISFNTDHLGDFFATFSKNAEELIKSSQEKIADYKADICSNLQCETKMMGDYSSSSMTKLVKYENQEKVLTFLLVKLDGIESLNNRLYFLLTFGYRGVSSLVSDKGQIEDVNSAINTLLEISIADYWIAKKADEAQQNDDNVEE